MLPISVSASSGVNGDATSGGGLAEHYFSAPFAVGSGASSTASQSKGDGQAIVYAAAAVAVVVVVALLLRRP